MHTSGVWTLSKTSLFHADWESDMSDCSGVPDGISSLTNWQALVDEIQEIPTREVTFVSAKLKTAPTRSVPSAEGKDPYSVRLVPLPEKTL